LSSRKAADLSKLADISTYSALAKLRNGRDVEIRAQRPDDRHALIATVERSSANSLFRRFFAVRRHFSDREIAFFTNIDFVKQVALVATARQNGRTVIMGGCRYVVLRPGKAEIAFFVDDQYQGQGIGSELMRHLVAIAHEAGLEELVAEVLPDNIPMFKVLEKSGLPMTTRHEAEVTSVCLRLS